MTPPHLPEDLPPLKRIAATVLNYALDSLDALNTRSWDQGRAAAYNEMADDRSEPTAHVQGIPHTKLIIGYQPAVEPGSPGRVQSIFNAARIPLTAEIKSQLRGDCASYLAATRQPTADQWKAIFSSSHVTGVSGAAGTGKTMVLQFRVLLLHRYLSVPLDQITVLTFNRESRAEMAEGLIELFRQWDCILTEAEAYQVVKTPRSALLEQVKSLPDLAECVPFEVLSDQTSAAQEDGRPFDARLLPKQQDEMWKCLQRLYRTNSRFAELVVEMFGASMQVERLEVDNPDVVRRAPMGWRLSDSDGELCDFVEGIWKRAGKWPLEGVTAIRTDFTLRGRHYSSSGYVPQLNAYVCLGFDRTEERSLTRNPSVKSEAYKEVAVKRTLFQCYFPDRLIHLDSYEEAGHLVEALKALPNSPPSFEFKLKGSKKPVPLLVAFNESAMLFESLGLEVATVSGQMNFMAGDTDASFIEALGIFWQALERQLLALPKPSIPFGRMFELFSAQRPDNLRHVPMRALGRCRHLLIDNGEDLGVPVAGWVRGVMAEIRRRDNMSDAVKDLCTTLFIAGDSNQWVHGSMGSSPRHLTDMEELFQAPIPPVRIQLQECVRSPQAIVDAGHNLIQNLAVMPGRAIAAAHKARTPGEPVDVYGDESVTFQQLCQHHYAAGDRLLIFADTPEDIAWVDAAVGTLIRDDRVGSDRRIRVRAFHKSKALEADVVFMVGDPSVGDTSWYRNQLFKLAGFSVGGDLAPGDTVQENEALRLAHVAITRAKKRCYWFPMGWGKTQRTASTLIGLSTGIFNDRR